MENNTYFDEMYRISLYSSRFMVVPPFVWCCVHYTVNRGCVGEYTASPAIRFDVV